MDGSCRGDDSGQHRMTATYNRTIFAFCTETSAPSRG